jgi:hypothetical protein
MPGALAIPTFDQMLRPLLDLAAREPLTRSSGTAAMNAYFKLAAEEQEARIPSGGSA